MAETIAIARILPYLLGINPILVKAMTTSVRRITYLSIAAAGIGADHVADITKSADHFNRTQGITGGLAFARGYFYQCLEGPADVVGELIEKIKQDPRHHHVRILSDKIETTRLFSGWAMADGNDMLQDEINSILKRLLDKLQIQKPW